MGVLNLREVLGFVDVFPPIATPRDGMGLGWGALSYSLVVNLWFLLPLDFGPRSL